MILTVENSPRLLCISSDGGILSGCKGVQVEELWSLEAENLNELKYLPSSPVAFLVKFSFNDTLFHF